MNRIILIGRITHKPELKKTTSGKSVIKFSLAVHRNTRNKETGVYETDFITCTIWDKKADLMYEYVEKGDKLGILGRLYNENYTNKEGNLASSINVLVDELEFLEPRKSTNKQEIEKPQNIEKDLFKEFGEEIELNQENLPW